MRTSRVPLPTIVAIALAMTMLLPATAVIAAPEDHAPAAEAAASWIAAELAEPEPVFDEFGAVGSRADVVIALAAADAEYLAFWRSVDELAAGAEGYVGTGDGFGAPQAAKVILAASVAGIAADEIVAGRDLALELRGSMDAGGAFPGFGGPTFDMPDPFNQSLAMLALATTPDGIPAESEAWLTDAQCDDGAFTYDVVCPAAEGDEAADATGIAALALLASGADDRAALAGDWLEAGQAADGSLPSGFGPNANSTGVGAQALRALGRNSAADAAADFLVSLQLDVGPDAGALRFTPTVDVANGFATLQGVPGLVAGSYLDLEAPRVRPVVYADVAADSTFATEIGWLGAVGITRGCNPPSNDAFCPEDPVTRGQMAAFLTRALGLTTGSDVLPFVDVADSTFAGEILTIAEAGITAGCNPPENDRFCPDEVVTRGQMAAFLVRALDLPPGPGFPSFDVSRFVDDDGSVFEGDITRLAESGITAGCNPPENDRFCPDEPVTRGQMAAFFFRAIRR